jgi:hypothetical protein
MLAGYCWPQSARAGESLDLAVSSSDPTCSIVVARIGAEEVVVESIDDLEVAERSIPDGVEVDGCGWPSSLTITIDPSWQSGFYLVRLRNGSGEEAEAFFVVRASEPGDTLLVLSTSTWAAYNDWGGPSFYTGGHVSSQQRPLPRGFLDKPDPHKYRVARFGQLPRDEVKYYFDNYSYWSAAAGWANWERLFAAWAETNGLQLDYATSLDLHNDPDLLTPYRLYLSVGHDEYWSAAMRDSVEGWVEAGGSAAFFSGNTAFWQVRIEGADQRVVGYKMDYELDPVMGTDAQNSVSTMWSDPLCERPENEMTGVTFTRGGYAHCHAAPMGTGGYTVWRPRHWAFEGLALYPGDVVGAEPVVVGYECDGCELALVDGLPVPTGADGTPTNFEVLGSASARLWETPDIPAALGPSYIGEVNWVAKRLGGGDTPENRHRFAHGAAVMGAFTRGSGHVFTTGCTDWAYGLGDEAVSQITRNVVSHFVELEGDR